METTHDELAAPVDTSSPPPLAIHVGGRKYTVEPADAPITIGTNAAVATDASADRTDTSSTGA